MAAPLDDSNCWFLTGPTASGKTAVGIALARRLGGEIVSLDSMALYRGMDIGTAKPTADQRADVPHHLIDIVEPHETFSLAHYVDAATRCVRDIAARGRQAIFVGGTPLYLKALLRGIFSGPPADWAFRERTETAARERGGDWLVEQVRTVDPAAAARLHHKDTKRLIRVLEVYEKTGQPISQLQQEFDRSRPAEQCRVFVLDWPREELYRRINARVEAMFTAGLVDEVRALVAREKPLSHTAAQALGYREVIEHLRGERTSAETIELVQSRTRAFARRQLTWFRSLSECRWVSMTGDRDTAAVAHQILVTASP